MSIASKHGVGVRLHIEGVRLMKLADRMEAVYMYVLFILSCTQDVSVHAASALCI